MIGLCLRIEFIVRVASVLHRSLAVTLRPWLLGSQQQLPTSQCSNVCKRHGAGVAAKKPQLVHQAPLQPKLSLVFNQAVLQRLPHCHGVLHASAYHAFQVRERTVHDYQASLDSIINWQPSGQTLYIPDAPRHLPVAVQLTWQQHSSSATGSTAAAGEDAATPAASAARQLTHAEQQTLQQISSVVQQQLGHPLPDRAFVGERSFLLSSLAAAAVSERLKRWVGCCSKAYVSQLMTKEPCLLGQEPQVLLKTLEALNQQLQMPTEQCVAFALKYVVVVGLDAAELAARVEGLRDACGYDWEQAVKLVTAAPELLVVHPSSLKVWVSLSFSSCFCYMPCPRHCVCAAGPSKSNMRCLPLTQALSTECQPGRRKDCRPVKPAPVCVLSSASRCAPLPHLPHMPRARCPCRSACKRWPSCCQRPHPSCPVWCSKVPSCWCAPLVPLLG